MNWKTGLPAAARLIVTLMPTGAFSRNHNILGGLSPSSGSALGGGSSILSGGTSLLGSHAGSLTSGLTNGVASVASPVASTFTKRLNWSRIVQALITTEYSTMVYSIRTNTNVIF